MLTDTQRKYLTELIGECFHQFKLPNELGGNTCINCGKRIDNISSWRTFTTPDDFFAVVRAITERDFWFILTAFRKQYSNRHWGLATVMQQPDFIEKFMVEVCKMRGVE